MKMILSVATCVAILGGATVAQAGQHAHFAAFFNTGATGSHAIFPKQIKGDHIEQDMRKNGADMMVFAHSAGIRSGDVWSIQNDTLRQEAGEYKDFGVDCQLGMNVAPFTVSGLCSVYMFGHDGDGQEKVKHVITTMSPAEDVVWYKLFEDKEHGVAGYFMRETAADFNH